MEIRLGYGLYAHGFRVLKESDLHAVDKTLGVKEGDLLISFGLLPNQVESGSDLSEEEKKFAKEHNKCDLVMTKEYAKRLIGQLARFIDGEIEES